MTVAARWKMTFAARWLMVLFLCAAMTPFLTAQNPRGALRGVVQDAAHIGLRVQTLGSGLAKEQAPAAGKQIPFPTF